MKFFDVAKITLSKIVLDDMPFALALRNANKANNLSSQDLTNLTALVGCELRHQLVFDSLFKSISNDVTFEQTIFARFYLTNHLFLKRFNDEEILDLARKDMDLDVLNQVTDFVNSGKDMIPEDLDKAGPEFLSLRFNTPSWIIRMWQKQFGKGLVFKLLKHNYHQSIPTVRVDVNKISIESFMSKHPDFVKSEVENVLLYQGRGTPKSLEEFKTNKIFFMKPATKIVTDKVTLDPFTKTAIFAGVPNNIYLEILARLNGNANLDIVTSHGQNYYDTKKIVDSLGKDSVALYRTEPENIRTCISTTVDNFFCLPSSTCLDLLRSTPDYFLRIKQEKLDDIIAKEKLTLNECANLVSEGGSLVYMVPTLSKKETTALVGEFLSDHKEFELIEEKQFVPFDSFDSLLYYAILKKNSND